MTEKILNISVNGALGNMGRYVMDAVSESKDMKLCFGVDKKSEKISINNTEISIYDSLDLKNNDIDVLVDFTNVESTMNILKECGENKPRGCCPKL